MKKIQLVCLLLIITLFYGCNSGHINDDNMSNKTDSVENSTTETSPTSGPFTEDNDVPDNFEPVLRVAVCSDIHFKKAGTPESERLIKLFESAYEYSASKASHPVLDAIIIAGDLTDTGTVAEYNALKELIKSNIKHETTLLSVWGNNHDTKDNYKKYFESELKQHIIVNGFHFIGLSPSSNKGDYSDEDIKWLAKNLEVANADDPKKPIFTFRHHHIKDTVYVSPEWSTNESSSAKLNNTLKNYSQVIDFSGHSHGPINNPKSIWQGEYTAFGTGTLSYFEMESGMSYGTLPPNREQAAQYYIVEVDAENHVRVMPYNILTGDFFKTPANDDEPSTQLVYYIDVPSDSTTFRYNSQERAKNATEPYFTDNAELVISDIKGKTAVLTIPQAIDAQCIYSYKIIYSDGNIKKQLNYFSDYYIEPLAKELNYTLTGLKPNTEYTVTVIPINCFNVMGVALNAKFKTPNSEQSTPYISENNVTYSGTFTNFESISTLTYSSNNFAYGGIINGDIALSELDYDKTINYSHASLAPGKGFNGSKALSISSEKTDNFQTVYIYATEHNKNTVKYPGTEYLRLWVDFTNIDFRKACFGFIDKEGNLYATDYEDGRTDQPFWIMKDGTDKWVKYNHGNDGCFGNAQNSSLKGFKGWMAFPTENFFGRTVPGTIEFSYGEIHGIYMLWNCSGHTYENQKFYLDEIHIVDDYTVFAEYN